MADVSGVGVGITGMACCLPSAVRTNHWWGERASMTGPLGESADRVAASGDDDDPALAVVRRWARDPFHGARERRVIDDAHTSKDLEVAACRAVLQQQSLASDDVAALIGYSQISDDVGLGNHGLVAHDLELPRTLLAFSLEAGCASFVPQVATATGLATQSQVLLYQSSATSRVTDYERPESVVTGDAAMAQTVGPVDAGLGFVDSVCITRGDLRESVVLAPEDGRRRWYEAGEHPTRMTIAIRNSRHVVQMGSVGPAFCREACLLLLERNGATPADVDFFVCAQPGAWFGDACALALEVPRSRIVPPEDHFQRYGHTLAASAPLNLWVAWTTGRLRKGDLVLVYSPGVGFTQAAMLMRWSLEPPAPRTARPVAP